ncbi:unnamed protein product, partial [Arabidopsis halleri]
MCDKCLLVIYEVDEEGMKVTMLLMPSSVLLVPRMAL